MGPNIYEKEGGNFHYAGKNCAILAAIYHKFCKDYVAFGGPEEYKNNEQLNSQIVHFCIWCQWHDKIFATLSLESMLRKNYIVAL